MRQPLVHRPAAVKAVAMGASAGGIDAVLRLFEGCPAPAAAPVVLVLHVPEDQGSHLAPVFRGRLGPYVEEARPGAPVEPGRLYLAPAGYHLLVEADRTFALSCDEPVLFSRPAIDVLMESCADAFGAGLVGVLLTGASEDGARGLAAVRAAGGLVLVQDPDEAAQATMPRAALKRVVPDAVLSLDEMKTVLQEMLNP